MSEIAYLLEEEIDNGENNYTITYTVTTTTTPNTPTDQPTTKTDNNYGTEQHDETELNGISESDKNKYFKKQDDGTYRINLTALAELFPSVNDLSTITVSQIKEALKGKTLKLENITGYTNNDKVENTDVKVPELKLMKSLKVW